MTILFYQAADGAGIPPSLPDDVERRTWRPALEGPPPAGSWRISNLVWWAFARSGVFSHPGFEEVTLWRGGRLAHRHILTPAWRRFPFMAAEDCQLGDVWTHPSARGQGLARAALAETCRRLEPGRGQLWYLTEAANASSVRLIEGLGFRLVGRGRRTRPLGVGRLGRFVLEA